MRITVDVRCFRTNDDGKTLTALLTDDAVLTIAPEDHQLPMKKGWCLVRPCGNFLMCQGPVYATREEVVQEMKTGHNIFQAYQIAYIALED
jgi:hypothetical protein